MKSLSHWSRFLLVALVGLVAAAVWNVGCGEAMGGGFGATQGGVQDMGFARELVENGQVPPPEAFVVEGMFSEHDLPLQGAACRQTLCLRTALGIAPTLSGEPSGWMQVGLSSTIDPATWQRPSLTLVAAVDVSGSMGWGDSDDEYPSPGQITKHLLAEITGRLGAGDRFALVTYGSSVKTALDVTSGAEQARIQDAIDELSSSGSTNMEAGLERAFAIARGEVGKREQTRVMLFTDVQPNVGLTGASGFEEMARENAEADVGLTVFGVGLGLGQEIMNGMSHLRGGNAFGLFRAGHVDELLEDSWPWMVAPVAYDLELSVRPTEGFTVAESHGIPAEADGVVAEQKVATVFLSRRRGAVLVRFGLEGATDVSDLQVTGRLAFTDLDGQGHLAEVAEAFTGEEVLDERGHFYAQPSVGKTVALAVLVQAMKDAATVYAEDGAQAVTLMTAAVERFAADAEALESEPLAAELAFAEALLQLMEQGAEQGDLYGM